MTEEEAILTVAVRISTQGGEAVLTIDVFLSNFEQPRPWENHRSQCGSPRYPTRYYRSGNMNSSPCDHRKEINTVHTIESPKENQLVNSMIARMT